MTRPRERSDRWAVIEFVKDVGRRLGVGDTPPAQSADAPATPPGPDAQKAAALVRLVEQMSLTVEHLGIQVDGERVTLTGTTDSQETREKLVLLVGNVHGVGQVDDQLQVAQPAPETLFYTVKRGDTLSKIAHRHTTVMPPNTRGSSRRTGRCSGTPTRFTRGRRCASPNKYRWGATGSSLQEKRVAPMADNVTGVRRRYPLPAWPHWGWA